MTDSKGRRHLPLAGAHNIRDIGGYTTQDGQATRWRTFLRADSLHNLSPDSQKALIDYGLRTIIDLRFSHELDDEPNVFAQSDQVNYVNISLLEEAAPSAPRRILPNLESMYKFMLDERHTAMKAIFDTMLTDGFPVLIHCTVGKDRTGLVSALMLGLAGVDNQTIAEDYALTAHYGQDLFAELREKAAARGRDLDAYEKYLEAKPEAMLNTLAHLEKHYHDVPTYLQEIGLSQAEVSQLQQTIRA
ncbi:MAG: tyrosine-protein phosphatase [Chloroflexota bacterium]